MSGKLTREQFVQMATSIIGALALVLVAFGVLSEGAAPEPTARGTTNFDTITLSDDLNVGDDADIDGSLTVGANALYPMGNATDGQAVYAASATVTGTSVLNTAQHGFTTIVGAVCDINAAPATGAGDPAFCVPVVSGSTVTITVKQDDWTTDATGGALTSYAIFGTP